MYRVALQKGITDDLGGEVEERLKSKEMLKAEHQELEVYVEQQGREWARRMLEAQFALRAALEEHVEVVGVDKVKRPFARDSERRMRR